jgi:hypothetical protein
MLPPLSAHHVTHYVDQIDRHLMHDVDRHVTHDLNDLLVSSGPPAALFEREEGGTTVTGQCASHTLPRLHVQQPHKQYRAACIQRATLFPLPLVPAMSPPVPIH